MSHVASQLLICSEAVSTPSGKSPPRGDTISFLHVTIRATHPTRPINLIRLSPNIRLPFIVKGVAFSPPLFNQPFHHCSVVLSESHRHFLPSYYITSHFLSIRLPSTGPVNLNADPQPLNRGCQTPGNRMHPNCHCLHFS
jgi:hypothetical protein